MPPTQTIFPFPSSRSEALAAFTNSGIAWLPGKKKTGAPLPERRSVYDRLIPDLVAPAAPATAPAAAFLLGLRPFGPFFSRERGPAAAGLRRVRIVDLEAAALKRIVEVDRGAVEILMAAHVDDHLDALRFEHEVVRRRRLVRDLHTVRHARAAAARDEDSDALERASLLLHDLLDLGRGLVAQGDHCGLFLRFDRFGAGAIALGQSNIRALCLDAPTPKAVQSIQPQ